MDIDKIRSIRALVSLEAPDSTVQVPVADLRELAVTSEKDTIAVSVGDLRDLLDSAEKAGNA